MVKSFLFSFSLILFVILPVRIELSGIWESYKDPDHVNEVALGLYLFYESIVNAMT